MEEKRNKRLPIRMSESEKSRIVSFSRELQCSISDLLRSGIRETPEYHQLQIQTDDINALTMQLNRVMKIHELFLFYFPVSADSDHFLRESEQVCSTIERTGNSLIRKIEASRNMAKAEMSRLLSSDLSIISTARSGRNAVCSYTLCVSLSESERQVLHELSCRCGCSKSGILKAMALHQAALGILYISVNDAGSLAAVLERYNIFSEAIIGRLSAVKTRGRGLHGKNYLFLLMEFK